MSVVIRTVLLLIASNVLMTFAWYAHLKDLNDKLYTSLIPTLLKTNVTVCLENLFGGAGGIISGVCSNPHEAVEMIDRYNALAGKECFGLCKA